MVNGKGSMKTTLYLSAALLTAIVFVKASSAGPSTWIVERYYVSETWSSFADIGKKDNGGPGDIYTSQQSLTMKDGHHAGVVNGFGVNLRKPYVFFHWTASLDGGTLTIGSAIDLMDTRATYPINGGTGRYAGTGGTVTITDAGKNRSLVVVRYKR
jgi:hypothetical protein